MRKAYGKTWWGQQWLKALDDVDEENRIPRGRTYANNGSVTTIKLDENIISAKVKGTQPRPYSVELVFEKFSESMQENIKQLISKSPSTLLALANHKLPPSLFNDMQDLGIRLFPQNFYDSMEVSCSCPDYAVPCKHIAAVLYVLCDLIDNDPFTIFEIHGCDLKKLVENLEKYSNVSKITTVESLFTSQKKSKTSKRSQTDMITAIKSIDFSEIQSCVQTTMAILPEEQSFTDQNFKVSIKRYYDYLAIIPKSFYECPIQSIKRSYRGFERWEDVSISLNNRLQIESCFLITRDKKEVVFPRMLTMFLSSYPISNINLLNDKLKFLHALFLFTQKLMSKGAFTPQILQNKNGETLIRWIPAIYDEKISAIVDQFAQICPQIISNFDIKSDRREQVISIISMFLSLLIEKEELIKRKILFYNTPIQNLFFNNSPQKFSAFNETGIPTAIDSWLRKLYRKSNRICLIVEENDQTFSLDIKIFLNSQEEKPIALKTAIKRLPKNEQVELMTDISYLSCYLPEIDQILDSKKPVTFELSDFTDVFLRILPILKTIGVKILLPKSLRNILVPQLSLKIKSDNVSAKNSSFLSLTDICHFDWRIAIGDQTFNVDEFLKILRKAKGLVKIRDNYVLINESDLSSMLEKYEKLKDREFSSYEILQAGLNREFDTYPVTFESHFEKLIHKLTSYSAKKLPQNLNAKLRPYQEKGYSWMLQNLESGFGCILADDMGLGKTLQVISVMQYFKNSNQLSDKKIIVIVPTSLLSNWRQEIEKFAPDLSVKTYHGTSRDLEGDFDILLTSYSLIQRDITKLNNSVWFLAIVDEAQNIKNPLSKQSKAVKSLNAIHKIAMSGTPVENRLMDYWSIFDFVEHGYLGTKKDFHNNYVIPIEFEKNSDTLNKFKQITKPFILRRCKTDKKIITDLPEKIENNSFCSLSKTQAALYQEIINKQMKDIIESDGINRKGLIFKLINDLKQVCNHPAQYTKSTNISIDDSGKTAMLFNILENIYYESNDKTIIFTQYTEMGNILMKLLKENLTENVEFFHGRLSTKKRSEIVDDFQHSDQFRILLVSLKAGGTGLNLTAASNVIHYDLWWNPAVENQASDRAYRIGQHKNVMVYRLLSENTLEERINDVIQNKKQLIDLSVESGESWITNLNNDQLKKLITLTRNESRNGLSTH